MNASASCQRLDAVVGHPDVVARESEQQRQRLGGIVVVVGHENAPRLIARERPRLSAGGREKLQAGSRHDRQPDDELGAVADAVAVTR